MLTPQEQALLNRLLRGAHPTAVQRDLIRRLQTKAGLPLQISEAEQRYRDYVDLRRINNARFSTLGIAGAATQRYSYTRIIEVQPRRGLGRNTATLAAGNVGGGHLGRYHIIRVDSPIRLIGVGIEEGFRLAIRDFRRLTNYQGPIRFVTPFETGREPPRYYIPPNEELIRRLEYLLRLDFFEPPEDVIDDLEF